MRRALCCAALVVALVAGAPAASTPAEAAGPTFHDAAGLDVRAVRRIDERQYDVTFATAALARPVHVRILLPTGYATSTRRYPTLHLLTGTFGSAPDWVESGRADEVTAGKPLIVVMPDVMFAAAGWFADWQDQRTALGAARWETFHVRQLIPWLDANLRTRASRTGRAIAGLSQGGFGAMTYAARHPDAFVSAASMSGAINLAWGDDAGLGHSFVTATEGVAGVPPGSIFGNPLTHEANWQGHDPASMVANLRDLDVRLYTGNGAPGPLDDDPAAAPDGIEVLGRRLTRTFTDRARQVGIPVHLVDYGPGTHTWPYWTRDLRWYLPHVMAAFADPPAHPSVRFQSADPTWTQWGWRVQFDRQARFELSELRGATARGFTLRGTGMAFVRTPASYRPGRSKRVVITAGGRTQVQHLVTDAAGRLRIRVPLGGIPQPAVLGRPTVPPTSATVTIS